MTEDNLFVRVMEAEGELLPAFDEAEDLGGEEGDMEAPADEGIPETPGGPPPLADDADFAYDEGDPEGGAQGEEEDAPGDNSIASKSNDILNQELYQKFLERNQFIEDTLEDIRKIVPILSIQEVNKIDPALTKLTQALAKGQEYVVNTFINMGYGENLAYYTRLETLYSLLLNQLERNLPNKK